MTSSTPSPASPSSSSGSRDGSVLGADPLAGLNPDLDARTPHHHSPNSHDCAEHDHDGPQASGGFVRPARAEDLTAIGQVQAATMLASLEAGHTAEHSAPLPAGVRAMIAAPVIAAGWETAVAAPPSPEHHVLVATTAQADAASRTVVGLLGLAPTQSMDAEGHVDEAGVQAVEVTALGVEPASQRRGHGSRLLAAGPGRSWPGQCAGMSRSAGSCPRWAWRRPGPTGCSASARASLRTAGRPRCSASPFLTDSRLVPYPLPRLRGRAGRPGRWSGRGGWRPAGQRGPRRA